MALNTNNWTQANYYVFKNIQEQLKEEHKRLYTEKWQELMDEIDDCYGDPTKFWNRIKTLMGGTPNKVSKMMDENGKETSEDNKKEEIHRRYLTKVFQISPQDNVNFDRENEYRINQYLQANK